MAPHHRKLTTAAANRTTNRTRTGAVDEVTVALFDSELQSPGQKKKKPSSHKRLLYAVFYLLSVIERLVCPFAGNNVETRVVHTYTITYLKHKAPDNNVTHSPNSSLIDCFFFFFFYRITRYLKRSKRDFSFRFTKSSLS